MQVESRKFCVQLGFSYILCLGSYAINIFVFAGRYVKCFCVYTYLTTFMDSRRIVCGNVFSGSLPNGIELALFGSVWFRFVLDWIGPL